MKTAIFLPDINIWLALIFESHIHHAITVDWFNSIENPGFCFCRMTQQGLLRLSTNTAVFKDEALTLNKAWKIWDKLLSDPRISFLAEPPGLEHFWREYTGPESYTAKVWNDAYLAAFARSAGLTLVTLDKGFSKFRKLDHVILSK